ncbi:MAG: hypothetical protein CVU07_12485, partial [Bacteroidetes bacterium HGW-Bacteroidetes-23]
QLNSTQLNSTQLNSTQLNSTQLNSTQSNLTKFFIAIVFLVTSCSEENFNEDVLNINRQEEMVSVKDGRLVFSNTTMLKEKIEELKGKSRKDASEDVSKFVNKGFSPLRVLFDNNISTDDIGSSSRTQFANDYTGATIEEDFDDFEETIGDDEFATLVNNSGEIQVADTIYKYTPVGLYYTHESTIQKLYDYLDTQSIDNIKLVPANYANSSSDLSGLCIVEKNDPYIKQIEPDIKYFAVESCSNVTYTSDLPADINSGSQTTSGTFDVDAFINSLPECNSRSSLVGRIFGKSISCTSKFDDTHRIKTKFWDQDYKIYQSIGVAVKHQTKKVWIWWTTDTDELRLGINNAYFEYNLPSPNAVLENAALTLYVHNQKLYTSKGIFIKNVLGDPLFSDFPFDSSLSVILDLRSLGFGQLNFTGDDFNKEPQKQIWNQAKAFLKNLNGQDAKELTIMGYLPQKV